MNIALAHFRVGETDGVSLEMDKWKTVLEAMGHKCFFLAGSAGDCDAFIIDEMHYMDECNDRIVENCYDELLMDVNELQTQITQMAKTIEEKLIYFLEKEHIDVVVPNNIWSLGWNLPTAIAFTNVAKKKQNIKFVAHNHDFYWERVRYSNPTAPFVSEILRQYFMPSFQNVTHCVINSIAQEQVKHRCNLDSVIVPNVLDFSNKQWEKDEYNQDFRLSCGIAPNDVVFLQATRITQRKAIEFAIDTLGMLEKNRQKLIGKTLYNGKVFTEDSNIVLLFIGINETKKYWSFLKQKMEALGIHYCVASDMVKHSRSTKNAKKIYSIWDSYVFADFVSYPSILEGWGNQLLEALFARKPVLLFEYPVFQSDIKDTGIKYCSLGNCYTGKQGNLSLPSGVCEQAMQQIQEVLFDAKEYMAQIDNNYNIAKQHFSYKTLARILTEVI